MTIQEVIKKRKSCRTYNQEHLTTAHKKALEDFIGQNDKSFTKDTFANEQEIKLFIVEKQPGEKKMRITYGAISGHNTYILGMAKDNPLARLNYGYLMEKLVLKATELGLATCWVGLFDHDYFNDLNTDAGYVVPGIVVIGYAAEKPTLSEKFIRFTANASQRLPWNQLFFNYFTKAALTLETAKEYSDSLEMVRLAPSSSNTQPWRIFFDETANEFHFFKKPKNLIYERMGMHELDLGIAMTHFELTSQNNGLTGCWIKHSEGVITTATDLQYMITWRNE